MGKETTPYVPADKLALYDRLLATNPNVERKGEAMPYTSLNGHMFSFLTPSGGLALRLPEPARREFLERYQTTLCEQHGVLLPEYVNVPETLFENIEEMSKHFDVAYMYVATLMPKPTTRSMKTSAKKVVAGAKTAGRGIKKTARKPATKKAAKTTPGATNKAAAKKAATKKATTKKAATKKAATKKAATKKAAARPATKKATRKPATKQAASKASTKTTSRKAARKPATRKAPQATSKAAKKPPSMTNHTPVRAPRKGAAKRNRASARRPGRRQTT